MTYYAGPKISNHQRQVLHGTILGGSSLVYPKLGKNCYLAMRDSDRNWLDYKTSQLNPLFKMDDKVIKKDKNTFRSYSIAYPTLNQVYNIFYDCGTKIITKDILEGLNDMAWMVWFVDAGRKTSDKIYLRTHKFGETGNDVICSYFNSLGCECEKQMTKNRTEICFTNKGSHEFMKTIVHRMPKFILDQYE